MAKERKVVPEILDSLPSDDPRAVRCRIDLHRINLVMGNYRWIASRIAEASRSGIMKWHEPGAGDGPIVRALPHSVIESITVNAVDFDPRPQGWPPHWDWTQGDLFDFLRSNSDGDGDEGLVANLFLHHFEEDDLRRVGEALQTSYSRLLISEPARMSCFEWMARPFFPLVNEVTRHDMIVSIRAGFRKGELPELLGLDSKVWKLTESVTLLGAYRLDARKRE